MTRNHRKRAPRVRPWPNSTFSIEIETSHDRWDRCKHVWAYLRRSTPTRHGRLTIMHGIIPLRKRMDVADKTFASPAYRQGVIRSAITTLLRAGVSDEQAKVFMAKVAAKYPPPTKEELYFERLNDPLVSMPLGERRKELSYFRTGVPEWTREDVKLVEECWNDLQRRSKTDPAVLRKMTEVILGPR